MDLNNKCASLVAGNEIKSLHASKRSRNRSSNSSSSAALSMAIALGKASPSFGITANASKVKGRANSNDLVQDNSYVTVGNQLNIQSGGDTNARASGAGKASNITLQGVDVRATERIVVDAENKINLLAAKNSAEQHSKNSGQTGSLSPRTAYVLDNGHTYVTDIAGRVTYVEGKLVDFSKDRNPYQQKCAGKSGCVGDDGGHLIASVLGGAGYRLNLVPQSSELNRGRWLKMESY